MKQTVQVDLNCSPDRKDINMKTSLAPEWCHIGKSFILPSAQSTLPLDAWFSSMMIMRDICSICSGVAIVTSGLCIITTTLVTMTAFVTKDVAIKMNLLSIRSLKCSRMICKNGFVSS